MNPDLKMHSATPQQLRLDLENTSTPSYILNRDTRCKICYVSSKIHGNHFSEKERAESDHLLNRIDWGMRRGMEKNGSNKSNNGQDEVLTVRNSESGNSSQLTSTVSG